MARRFLNWWLRFGYWLLLRLQVRGLENVPADGPVILMINHVNFLDPFVVVASMPRQVTAMSKIENFSIPLWGWVFKWYGAIPVHRGEVDRKALKAALDVLKTDTMLLIAPEGTRSKTGALIRAKTGAAYLADQAKVLIVPIAIAGTESIMRNLLRLRRSRLIVQIGKPFLLPAIQDNDRSKGLRRNTDEIMCRIAAMLPQAYRGVYADHPRLKELLDETGISFSNPPTD